MRWFIIICLFAISSCSSEVKIIPMQGSFIFGTQGLNSLDLESNAVTKIVDTPSRLVNHFDFVTSDKILVSVYELNATNTRAKIEIWSPDGTILQEFGLGSNAVFFEKHNAVVFHNANGHLVRRNLMGSNAEQETIEQKNKFQNEPVVKTSDSSFLFIKEVSHNYEIYEFSFLTNTVVAKQEFRNCSLDKSLWVTQMKSLLCQQRENNGKITGNYFLKDINGKSTPVDFGVSGAWPIAVFNESSFILLQERTTTNMGTKEVHPLWAYDLIEKKSVKVAENVYIPSEIKERKHKFSNFK